MPQTTARTLSRIAGFSSFIGVCITSSVRAQADSLLITAGRAGRFEIGMAVEDVYSIVGQKRVRLVDQQNEGEFSPAIEIRLLGATVNPSIVAPIREWPCVGRYSLQGLDIRDPRFRLATGIHVGSTLGELRKVYKVEMSNEEGPHAMVVALHITFILANASGTDSVRITSVWIPALDMAAIRLKFCPGRGPNGPAMR